jgi:hypothetical protein
MNMLHEKKCLRCGGTNLEPGVLHAFDGVYFRAENTKFMTLQTPNIDISAQVCLDCGAMDLVADVAKVKSLVRRANSA